MPGMAMCWKTITETHQTDKLSLTDGLEMLLQSELDNRQNNKIERLIKNASFRQRATIEELELSESRGINESIANRLATGEYLKNGATIVISGPTGTGKSFLATALGERACRQGYKVRYYTVQRLFDELKLARLEGHELKFFEKTEQLDLLIIDDFGMKKLEGQQQNDFEQIIDDRYHKCIKRSIPTQKNGIKRVKNAKNIHKTRLKNGAYPFTLLKMGQKNGE